MGRLTRAFRAGWQRSTTIVALLALLWWLFQSYSDNQWALLVIALLAWVLIALAIGSRKQAKERNR